MRIAFWLTSTTREMSAENWGKVPMGGAEISALNLGDELRKKDWDVTYFLQYAQSFDSHNIHVRRQEEIFDALRELEIEYFVCVRPHPVLEQNFEIKKILWSGDAFDQPSNDIFWQKNVADSMDALVFKSCWQRERILDKYFYIDPKKTEVITNGIKGDLFVDLDHIEPQKKRFIHASTWYRGAFNFIDIWPEILRNIPSAEIHVFSKTSLYFDQNPRDTTGWASIAEELCQYPGMILREPVPQWILAQELRKAWLMLYPNTGFVESSCGVALQAMAAGTPVVTTARAGLIETVGPYGVLIEEKDGWQEEFVKAVCDLSWKKERRTALSNSGRQKALSESWEKKATEWTDFLLSL